MNESQELSKELILKDIYVSSIEDDCTLWGGLTAIFDSNTYYIEDGSEICLVFLQGQDEDPCCGAEIPAGPYSRILDAYITDYINDYFTNASNEVHIYIREDDLTKPRWQLLHKN